MTTNTECLRCHRKLTDPKSISRGYGPKCAAKVAKADLADLTPRQARKVFLLLSERRVKVIGTDVRIEAAPYEIIWANANECGCEGFAHTGFCHHLGASRIALAA